MIKSKEDITNYDSTPRRSKTNAFLAALTLGACVATPGCAANVEAASAPASSHSVEDENGTSVEDSLNDPTKESTSDNQEITAAYIDKSAQVFAGQIGDMEEIISVQSRAGCELLGDDDTFTSFTCELENPSGDKKNEYVLTTTHADDGTAAQVDIAKNDAGSSFENLVSVSIAKDATGQWSSHESGTAVEEETFLSTNSAQNNLDESLVAISTDPADYKKHEADAQAVIDELKVIF